VKTVLVQPTPSLVPVWCMHKHWLQSNPGHPGLLFYLSMYIFPKLTMLVQNSEQFNPLWSAFYPRRIIVPAGYCDPKYYAVSLCGMAKAAFSASAVYNFVDSSSGYIAKGLMSVKVPTYFLQYDFITDVSNSRIETSMKMGDLVLPDKAMLFVLPEKFSREYNFGLHIPFVSMTYLSYEDTQQPNIKQINPPPGGMVDGIYLCHYVWFGDNELPSDYFFNHPGHLALQVINDKCEEIITETSEYDKLTGDYVGMEDPKMEVRIMSNMTFLMAKLLLALMAEPKMIEKGVIARPSKVKKGRFRSELWNPHLIGWKYQHDKAPPGGGTHASPRLHRRVGHFRDQAYGPGWSERKVKWIRPMWVGLKAEEKNE